MLGSQGSITHTASFVQVELGSAKSDARASVCCMLDPELQHQDEDNNESRQKAAAGQTLTLSAATELQVTDASIEMPVEASSLSDPVLSVNCPFGTGPWFWLFQAKKPCCRVLEPIVSTLYSILLCPRMASPEMNQCILAQSGGVPACLFCGAHPWRVCR